MLREVDSIERILDDAKKSAMKYWDCDEQKCCFECPSREVHVECTKAQRIDLVKRTRAMFKRQLPEGVEWPRYEDGEMVRLGDEVELPDGAVDRVLKVALDGYGCTLICGERETGYAHWGRVKRSVRDTQERIDADAGKVVCEYFGWGSRLCEDDDGSCPARLIVDRDGCKCDEVMIRDLLRRQRELCEGEAR